jgi:hypothetical protein
MFTARVGKAVVASIGGVFAAEGSRSKKNAAIARKEHPKSRPTRVITIGRVVCLALVS